MPLFLRLGTRKELVDLQTLSWETSVYASIYTQQEREAIYKNPDLMQATWFKQIEREIGYYVADAGQGAIGVIGLHRLSSNYGLVEPMHVVADSRGKGAGVMMWRVVAAMALDLGLRGLRVFTLNKNPRAMTFYRERCQCVSSGETGAVTVGLHVELATGLVWEQHIDTAKVSEPDHPGQPTKRAPASFHRVMPPSGPYPGSQVFPPELFPKGATLRPPFAAPFPSMRSCSNRRAMRRRPNLPGATADSELDYLLGLPVLPLPTSPTTGATLELLH